MARSRFGISHQTWYALDRLMPTVSLSPRDRSMLRLLSWTPATTGLLWQASATFEGDPFLYERRLRERLQALTEAKIVRSWATAHAGGGLQNYYKLTPEGFAMTCGPEAAKPSRTFFDAVSPSLFVHTFRLAEAIVVTLCACHARRIEIVRFIRENELTFTAGDARVQPDGFFRLLAQGKYFNIALEIDNSMASVDAFAGNSIRQKLSTYYAYQDQRLSLWLTHGKRWEKPRFRVVFLTPSAERAYHILSLASALNPHPSRRLVYAAPFDDFVTDPDPLYDPLFLDHAGRWQALVDLHPTAPFQKAPVRLQEPMESLLGV